MGNAVVVIDAAPFRQWYESHYALPLARKKGAKLTDQEEAVLNKKRSKKTARKYAERQKTGDVEKALVDQFQTGRVLAAISSRPDSAGGLTATSSRARSSSSTCGRSSRGRA